MRTESSAEVSRKSKKELARRLRSADPGLEVVHPDAAGIDVGNESHYVAVRPDRDPESVLRFACFTADLYRMRSGCEVVALRLSRCNQRVFTGFPCTTCWRSSDLRSSL
jgi:hypothetical protein